MFKKEKPKECTESCCKSPSKSWVFIIKEFMEKNGEPFTESANIVKLRHPRTKEGALFLFSSGNKMIQEILCFNDQKRSFFIDDNVKSDGRIFFSSPIDPIFLTLPYLKEYGKCSPLDQILGDNDFPNIDKLLDCSGLEYIHQVADKKGDETLNAYAYNEEKTLKWLEKKVRRVASVLKEKQFHVSLSNVVSANFVVNKESEESEDSYLRYALGIVADYLPGEITVELERHLNLPSSELDKKRKSATVDNGVIEHSINKRAKYEDDISPPSAKEKKRTPSAKTKAMAKAASGSKNIMSFFTKK